MSRYNLRPRNLQTRVSPGMKYSTIHLHLLPSELIDMIFRFSLLKTRGKTSSLLIALRPEPELYFQAIRVYYFVNEFEVRCGEGWAGGSLKGEVKGLVRKVVVMIPTDKTLIPQLHSSLSLLTSLTSLKLRSTNTTALQLFEIPSLLQPQPSSSLPKFQFLTTIKIEAKLKTSRYPGAGSGIIVAAQRLGSEWDAKMEIRGVEEAIEKVLGVKVKGEKRVLDRGGEVPVVVLKWEAERGRVLLG